MTRRGDRDEQPSNVVPLRPRPPTKYIPLNAPELKLLVASLDNSLEDLRRLAPSERAASVGVRALRLRLALSLAQLEGDGAG